MLIGCGATKISSDEAFKYERMYAQQSSNIEKPKTKYKYVQTQNIKLEGYSNYDDINYGYAMQVTYGQGDINVVNTWFYEDDKLQAIFQSSPFLDTSALMYLNPLHNYAYRFTDYRL